MVKAPHDELDSNIVRLVRVLNAFEGIETLGSCGGHADPQPGQAPEGSWWVTFRVTRDEAGWYALEFLAWLINNDYREAGHHVQLYPTAPPPYLNDPGQVLRFALEGHDDEDPDQLAEWIHEMKKARYVPPADVGE